MAAPQNFYDVILAHGMVPPEDMVPDKFYRMAGVGKRPTNTDGWCVEFADCLGGCFGDWSTGESYTWQSQSRHKLSKSQRALLTRRARESKAKADRELHTRHARAALRARAILRNATPADPNFPYLVNKAIPPLSAKSDGASLVLRLVDFSWQTTSIQYIYEDGRKKLLSGGRKKGCFIPVNTDLISADTMIISEGWATGVTLASEYPEAMLIAAVDSGNLSSVATGASIKWPDLKIIIAGDDDRMKPLNVGRGKAEEAARLVGAEVMFPKFPKDAPAHLSDFNDLAVFLARGVA